MVLNRTLNIAYSVADFEPRVIRSAATYHRVRGKHRVWDPATERIPAIKYAHIQTSAPEYLEPFASTIAREKGAVEEELGDGRATFPFPDHSQHVGVGVLEVAIDDPGHILQRNVLEGLDGTNNEVVLDRYEVVVTQQDHSLFLQVPVVNPGGEREGGANTSPEQASIL